MTIGPYEIRASLGEGGGGAVYRAWDPRLERDVALKILHERFESDPERVRRFVAEARAASALNHPNIVTVFDAAVDSGNPYIVSELIDGRPLRDEVSRGPMPIKRLLDLATQIADGLAAAHDAGIVHSDLKPENIMVTRTGRVKILDFGLARVGGFQQGGGKPTANDLTKTQTEVGLIAGTIPYMSPEQARGLRTDFRSDQFSFGLILYEMATGHRAFRRESPAATLDAIINDELPPLSVLDARAPVLLRWMIERCLAKEPSDRYGATADLHRDLRTLHNRLAEALLTEQTQAPPTNRTRTLAFIAIGALVLIAAGIIASTLIAGPAPPDMSSLGFVPMAAEAAYEGFPAWSPTPSGQTIAYVAEVDGKLQIFTRAISSSESTQLTHQSYDCRHPFWSPDGQRIYYVSLARDKEGIWSIGAAGGTPQLVVQNATRGAISTDGRTLAFLRDEARADIVGTAALWLATPSGTAPWTPGAVEAAAKRRGTFDGFRFIEGSLAFSPDGRTLGVNVITGPGAETAWQFWIVPLPEGKEYRRLESWAAGLLPRITSFSWLPDNQHVVFGSTALSTPGAHLWLADLERDVAWPLTRGPESQSYPSTSPAGDQIAFATDEPNYDLVEISVDSGELRPLAPTTRNESDPELSPNGQQLAYVTDRRGQDEIWIRTRAGQVVDRPVVQQSNFGTDATLMLSSPSFSPDAQRLAYQRNGLRPRLPLRIWISTTAGGQPTMLPGDSQSIQGPPTWSPDGEWIAYAEWQDERWKLVKMRVGSGEKATVLRADGVANATPRWSPKNDWITWETEQGFALVSPDGKQERLGPSDVWLDDPWLVHNWSHDGSTILGIKETGDRHLALVTVDAATLKARTLKDLGPSPPVNSPVKGFNVSADGKTITTSVVRLRGDLWLVERLQWQRPSSWMPWSRRRPAP